jgi:nicotinate-nucleotide adenylyltransferase
MIGVLGGTFDPIHFGHIKPALELLRTLPLGEIRFIPCAVPPHRSTPIATPAQRWQMLNIVLRHQEGLRADDRELRREGPSYTVDTLLDLREELGEKESICLIMGNDVFRDLPTWNRWEQILGLAHIVIATRPGSGMPLSGPAAELLMRSRPNGAQMLKQRPCGGILPCEVTPVNVSSTTIRDCISNGQSPRYMLPGGVWNFIRRHGLYGVSEN